jgi:hypothetical protein
MKIREILTKINNAIRPAHVGKLEPTDMATRGGTADSAPWNAYTDTKRDYERPH